MGKKFDVSLLGLHMGKKFDVSLLGLHMGEKRGATRLL